MKSNTQDTSAYHYSNEITAKPCEYEGEVYAEMREMHFQRDFLKEEERIEFIFVFETRASKALYVNKNEVVGNVLQRLLMEPYFNYIFVLKTTNKCTVLMEKEMRYSFKTLVSKCYFRDPFLFKAYSKTNLTSEIQNDFNILESNLIRYEPFEPEMPIISFDYAHFLFRYQRLLVDIATQTDKENTD